MQEITGDFTDEPIDKDNGLKMRHVKSEKCVNNSGKIMFLLEDKIV